MLIRLDNDYTGTFTEYCVELEKLMEQLVVSIMSARRINTR